MAQRFPLADQCVLFDSKTEHLRWFMLPSEAQDLLLGNSQNVKHKVPFDPVKYCGSRGSISENGDSGQPMETPVMFPIMRANSLDFSRHNSLPTVERSSLSMFTAAPTISIVQSQPDLVWTDGVIHPDRTSLDLSSSPPQFAVGEAMRPTSVLPPGPLNTIVDEDSYPCRTRCYSLGSSTVTPPILSPQTMASLGIGQITTPIARQRRQCSCSSQTELNSLELETGSPIPSLGLLQLSTSVNDSSFYSQPSPGIGTTQSPEDLQAYVKEMTNEIATEIKSEIRGVISKVEDVLSESAEVAGDNHPLISGNGFSSDRLHDGIRGISVSSADVADYIVEFSKGMASKMKTEIREIVSAVDSLISLDNHQSLSPTHDRLSSPLSPADVTDSYTSVAGNILASKLVDLPGERTQSSECSSDETVIHIMTVDQKQNSAPTNVADKSSEDEDLEEEAYGDIGVENKHCLLMRSNINSVSSQDSGINLTFQESDSSSHSNYTTKSDEKLSVRKRKINLSLSDTSSTSSSVADRFSAKSVELGKDNTEALDDSCATGVCALSSEDMKSRLATTASGTCTTTRWHCPPKTIWKPAVEALQEFDMIRDGDRVMVCLSGGKDSLSLLHTLHQYQFYVRSKGIQFSLGAATVDPGSTAYDPRPLIPYLEALGVHYLYEEQGKDTGCATVSIQASVQSANVVVNSG
ncbi:hypothetical protein PR048_031626 [Dryococelus australis]|uniref:Uncharacterized protein n=1 Tax=Dryococelus australis TaxID=614101 RepID=A0ABQ9G8F9_9NEOP|nr:hypothetical protein PR048_031626 [Dryococelus australis]